MALNIIQSINQTVFEIGPKTVEKAPNKIKDNTTPKEKKKSGNTERQTDRVIGGSIVEHVTVCGLGKCLLQGSQVSVHEVNSLAELINGLRERLIYCPQSCALRLDVLFCIIEF